MLYLCAKIEFVKSLSASEVKKTIWLSWFQIYLNWSLEFTIMRWNWWFAERNFGWRTFNITSIRFRFNPNGILSTVVYYSSQNIYSYSEMNTYLITDVWFYFILIHFKLKIQFFIHQHTFTDIVKLKMEFLLSFLRKS